MLVSRGQRLFARRWLGKAYFHHSHSVHKKVSKTFKLADIGEGITECEVLKWNVKTPAKVDHFDLLCEVQSDKASVEITSPYHGTVTELLVKEGEIAKVGQGLCKIEVEEEDAATEGATESSPKTPSPVLQSHPLADNPKQPDSQSSPHKPARRPHPLDPNQPPKPTAPGSALPTDFDPEIEAKTLATPAVRHFAREKGIPRLSQLYPGSGKRGRIEKSDVEAWLSKSKTSEVPTKPQVEDNDLTIELGRTRWAMWKAMEQSLKIPHFGYSTTLDLTNLHNLLPVMNAHIPKEYNPSKPSTHLPAVSPYSVLPATMQNASVESDPTTHYEKLTYLPLLVKALARAMQEWPLFRASIAPRSENDTAAKPNLVIRPHADIAIALSTPTGLYTPTIQRADTLSAYELMGALRRFSALGRTIPHGLTPKEMPKKGATITVSNVGAIGKGEFASPLLVPGGGVAIVAIGRAKWVRRVEDGEKRLEVGVSWSADHRVVEGAEMAAFTETWRKWVEEPGLWAAGGR
ncbi:hypothetical protein FS837_000639 [Tulasnella sp. UAMH 9824]|nr:hypothetical protein FS837_000639 [Tulasnella sp. UAMH 9824]